MATHTFTVGEVLTAANTNLYLNSGLHRLLIRRVANQSIANGTVTDISFDTEDTDTDGYFAPTSANVTIPAGLGGIYAVSIQTVFAAATGALGSYVLIDNTTRGRVWRFCGDNGAADSQMAGSALILANAADVIQLTVFQTSGGALNMTAQLEMYLIGAG